MMTPAARRLAVPGPNDPRAGARRAFSLIEAVFSTIIIGVLFLAAMNTVGASQTTQFRNAQRKQALMLAQDMMAEILPLDYEDPRHPGGMGPDADEQTRMDYDDVDDYDGWSASPSQHRDGSVFSWARGFGRKVTVQRINASDLATASWSDTGIKRIDVTAEYNGQAVLTLFAFRSAAWQSPVISQGVGN